jgi:hypothetical protein
MVMILDLAPEGGMKFVKSKWRFSRRCVDPVRNLKQVMQLDFSHWQKKQVIVN